MSRDKHQNHNFESPTQPYTCVDCGNDLYNENNVLIEIKEAMDLHLDCTDPKLVGRPLYVIVIGDAGYELSTSPINDFSDKDNNKVLKQTLKDMIKYLKKDQRRNRR